MKNCFQIEKQGLSIVSDLAERMSVKLCSKMSHEFINIL